MPTVLVMGASRGIGLATVKEALAAGHRVRAMARTASNIRVDHPALERFAGDALDASAVRPALRDVDVVVQAIGVTPSPDLLIKPVRLFSEATQVLVPLMEETGVKRLICVTGFGAGDSRNRGSIPYNLAFSLLLGRIYEDKDVQERIIRESRLDWMIARPGILTNGPRTGAYRVLSEPRDWRSGIISRADVADFIIGQIDAPTCRHETPALVGRCGLTRAFRNNAPWPDRPARRTSH
ncbi:MAG: NAD(P)H-binding protein [Alphaproteobacteria bacterium]|jgi:putative NADH-flavin reductase|nr:NAD(P)H-binding protein [Alphaproteobacteria bacterium]